MPWEAANVPHGVVHHHYYRSNIVGINSEYYVYTPPHFTPGNKQKYPVLHLLHGYSDDPSAWTAMAKANVILDNLIAQGKAKPMIVVMPLGYGTMEVITGDGVAGTIPNWFAVIKADSQRCFFRKSCHWSSSNIRSRIDAKTMP